MKEMVRIGLIFSLTFTLNVTSAHAATVDDIALYRGADRQAKLERAAKAEGEFV